MCGIIGYYSFAGLNSDIEPVLDQAIASIQHRGPDSNGKYIDSKIAFGHARLSIIDPTELGNQPMIDASGNYVIVYNGVCYNHMELRKKLKVNFVSNSDTETVLYWLIEKGADGLKDLNGFFSLAIFDKRNKKILIARDRFGIKPLYFSVSNYGVTFSSELSALKIFTLSNELNPISLSAYAHLNYIPSPFTIYKDVEKLESGTYMTVNISRKVEQHRYFSVEFNHSKIAPKKEITIEQLLEESVRKRLMSDVPLGCFLSGGLDSSILTGLASRHVDKLNTYTLVFKGEKHFDESKDAAEVAKHFNTNHHEIEIQEHELLENVNSMLSTMDEPFADSSAIAMYSLCKSVSSHIKVALSGDGGDELFAGYHKHLALYMSFNYPNLSKSADKLSSWLQNMPTSREGVMANFLRKSEKFASSAALEPNLRYWNWAGYGNPTPEMVNNDLFNVRQFLFDVGQHNIVNFQDCLEMDLSMVLEGDMMVKTDRMSMRHGLEVRVPFLDHEFVEFIANIPAKNKIAFNQKKYLLKKSFEHMLPKSIMKKKKHGFEVPIKKWLRHELHDLKKDLLDLEFIEHQGIFELESVEKLEKLLRSKHSANSEYAIWNIMVFNSWWKRNMVQ